MFLYVPSKQTVQRCLIAFLSTQYEIKLYLFDKMKKYYDMREEKNESITDTFVRCNECFS